MVNQDLMWLNAIRQAKERSEREGVACYVFRRIGHPDLNSVTWYVRTDAEGAPEGCGTPEHIADPTDRV